MNVQMSLKILPIIEYEIDQYNIVDQVIKLIQSYQLPMIVGPSETTIEGDLDTILDIIRQSQVLCNKLGVKSLFTNVQISYSTNMIGINEKVEPYLKK